MLEPSTLSNSHPQPRVTALLSVADNIAPVSWHMPISRNPFIYGVALRSENYSYELVHKHKEFALNFLDYSYVEITDRMGGLHGNEVEKFLLSKFTKKNASQIETALIEQAYMVYECKVIDVVCYGDHDIFIAEVVAIHVDKEQNPDPTLFLGCGEYATITKLKRVERE